MSSAATAGEIIPDIIDPSLPQFTNDVTVTVSAGGVWNIRGTGDFTFNDGSQVWSGIRSNFRLHATFDDEGDLIDGTLRLFGNIPGLTLTDNDLLKYAFLGPRFANAALRRQHLLVSADLIDFGYSGSVIGFNTDNIICNDLLGVHCTTSESVLVFLDEIFSGNVNASFHASGEAVTSVPVPAALLMFLSGLGLLARHVRRRTGV